MTLKEATMAAERAYLVEAMRESGGNVCDAARLADVNRTHIYKLFERHNINPADFRGIGALIAGARR